MTPSAIALSQPAFDGEMAFQHIIAQVALGDRSVGSDGNQQTGDYLIEVLQASGWRVETQAFKFKGVQTRNIIAKKGSGPLIILGAHYDTRPLADLDPEPAKQHLPVPGANDGASGVAVLLELARVLNNPAREVWLVFFDAEDKGFIEGWPYMAGSRHMALTLTVKPEAVIIVDMVGDSQQQLYFDQNSNLALRQEIWSVAADLGYQETFIAKSKYRIFDDHVPFIEQGIPAVDIIDFDYPYWHTTADTIDKVSAESLERVGRTLLAWLEQQG